LKLKQLYKNNSKTCVNEQTVASAVFLGTHYNI
jgi:hypothetical protein